MAQLSTSTPTAYDSCPAARPIFRHSSRDAGLVALALAQGAALAAVGALSVDALDRRWGGLAGIAAIVFVAVGIWWGSNTVSHNHIHNPFFGYRALNLAFSAYLTSLLGIPQSVWKLRHLAHHAGTTIRRPYRLRARDALDVAIVAATWGLLATFALPFFLRVYLPGYALGLVLCRLQGHFEHAGSEGGRSLAQFRAHVSELGVSHYGALYNYLWFNDGYHAEHHRYPTEHWTRLPYRRRGGAAVEASPFPPLLRWVGWAAQWRVVTNRLQAAALAQLETLPLRSRSVGRFVVDAHERAFREVLPRLGAPTRIGVVGGGLFPRTAIVVRRLLPSSEIVIIDASRSNLAVAARVLGADAEGITFVEGTFDPAVHRGFDLVVFPLAFIGDRGALYSQGPEWRALGESCAILVHDWIWRRRGCEGAVVSTLLLKRLNLVGRTRR